MQGTITVKHPDNLFYIINLECTTHFVGYVGVVLQNFYNTQELAEKLVSLGDLTRLGPNLLNDVHTKHISQEPKCYGSWNAALREHQKFYNFLFEDGVWYYQEGLTPTFRLVDMVDEYTRNVTTRA